MPRRILRGYTSVLGYNGAVNLLFISSGMAAHLGGSARSERGVAAELSRHCNVHVVSRTDLLDEGFAKERGLTRITQYETRDILKHFRLPSALTELLDWADVVHINGHWRWEIYFIARWLRKRKKPYLIHPRGMCLVGHRKVWLKKIFNLLIGNYILKYSARVIVLSRYEGKQVQHYPVREDQILVLPNGISPPGTIPSGSLTVPVEGRFFLYIGRLESRKNIVFLCEAFAQYRARGGKALLFMVGPVEREYDQSVKASISRLEIEKSAFVLPPAYGDDKWQFMKRALAVVYPSVEEAFGRVPFEAVLAGTVPIVPVESGAFEYLQKFIPDCGHSLESSESLADRLLWAERGLESGEDLGVAEAAAWVKRDLNWKRIAAALMHLYQELAGRS